MLGPGRHGDATTESWLCNVGPVDLGMPERGFTGVKAVLNVPVEFGNGEESANLVAVSQPLGAAEHRLVRDQLQRTMASDAFRGSKRSRDFLSHIVERTLSGESDLLKERLIGVHLYGKDGAYDTSSDSTVRVRANEVRRRLLQYAEQFGRDEHYRILLPSGSYVPEFRPTARRAPLKQLALPREIKSATPPLHKGWLIGPTVAALLLSAFAFRWMLSPDSLFKEFWRPLVAGNHSLILEVETVPGPQSMIPLRSVRPLLRIHDIAHSLGGHAEIVTVGDAPLVSDEHSAQVLLGRTAGSTLPAPVPLRYRIETPAGAPAILDVVSGHRYGTQGIESGRQESFALVTRITPRSDSPSTLSLNGTDDVAVEAAEELVTDPATLADALRTAGVAAVEKDLQILLGVQHFGPEISKRHILSVQTYP
jgi:hypothetical protein